MKTPILITLILFSAYVSAQKVADFKNLESLPISKKYSTYITQTGDTLQIGDTLYVGKINSGDHFLHIVQGDQFCGPQISGYKLTINKLILQKSKSQPATMWIDFRGWGLLPVYIRYEQALEYGEVVNPRGKMSKPEAIEKLREAKELLELQLISQAQFDSLKTELGPIIQGK